MLTFLMLALRFEHEEYIGVRNHMHICGGAHLGDKTVVAIGVHARYHPLRPYAQHEHEEKASKHGLIVHVPVELVWMVRVNETLIRDFCDRGRMNMVEGYLHHIPRLHFQDAALRVDGAFHDLLPLLSHP